MIEKREYDYGDGWSRTIIIAHGSSEAQVIYDSTGELTDWSTPKEEKGFQWFYPDSLEEEILK